MKIRNKKKFRQRNNIKGFTIIEGLIAMAIFSIGILGLASLVVSSMNNTSQGNKITEAVMLAEAQMELLKNEDVFNSTLLNPAVFPATTVENNLSADGIVGETSWAALLGNKENNRIDDSKYVLTTKKYFNEPIAKKNIVLHHTNGWTVRKGTEDRPSMNHFNWWKSTSGHVSTAFSIDHKGNVYQHFDPQMWAYHLGIGGSRKYLDKQSIGIELVNEGHMVKKDNKFSHIIPGNLLLIVVIHHHFYTFYKNLYVQRRIEKQILFLSHNHVLFYLKICYLLSVLLLI